MFKLNDKESNYYAQIVQLDTCEKVPSEGICVRKETGQIEWFKLKSKAFLLRETAQLDKEELSIEDQN